MREDFVIMDNVKAQFEDEDGYKLAYEDKSKGLRMWIKAEPEGDQSLRFEVDRVEL